MKRIVQVALALLMLVPLTVAAQTTTMQVTYTWTAPTTGSPVAHYDVERSSDAGATWVAAGTPVSPSVTLTVPVLTVIIVRVRGVDATNRPGIWSATSDPYTADPGPPGGCGKPSRS